MLYRKQTYIEENVESLLHLKYRNKTLSTHMLLV